MKYRRYRGKRRSGKRRKESGLIETILKCIFGFGSTVAYSKDWLGRTRKKITYHDTGKSRTLTHGCGFFGDKTKVVRRQHGVITERGTQKKNWFFGTTETSEKSDGTRVVRKRYSLLFKNLVVTEISGPCHGCRGTGRTDSGDNCSKCSGSGIYNKTIVK